MRRHCEVGFSVGRRGTQCPSPQVGAGRYSGDNPNNPIKSKAIQEKRSRTNLWFSAMTCGWWNASKYVIAHLLRDLWIASSQAPRNEGKRKAAFTLAEVLITLGIIGIVAAMTLPTLIANYQKKVVETRLISFYSKINQAYRMSYAENGDTADWIISDKNYSYNEMLDWLEKYIFPYMKHYDVKQCNGKTTGQIGVCVTIPDGSLYWFSIDREGQDVIYYVNGNWNDTSPRNSFQFNFSKRVKNDGSANKQSMDFLSPYVFDWDGRRESLFTHGTWGCRKGCTNCGYCTKLIQLNGWEIPDDYPW